MNTNTKNQREETCGDCKDCRECWDYRLFEKFDNFMNKITPFIFILAVVYFGAHLLISLI